MVACTHTQDRKNNAVSGTGLRLLASANQRPVAYALYEVDTNRWDIDLVLILRNTGAKSIDADGVDASFFTIADDAGRPLIISSAIGMRNIGFDAIAVVNIHIYIPGYVSPETNYSLELRPKPNANCAISFKTPTFHFKEVGRKRKVKEALTTSHAEPPTTRAPGVHVQIVDHKCETKLAGIILTAPALWDPCPVVDVARYLQFCLDMYKSEIRVVLMPAALSLTVTNDWPEINARKRTALEYCQMIAANEGIDITIETNRIIIHKESIKGQPSAGLFPPENGRGSERGP